MSVSMARPTLSTTYPACTRGCERPPNNCGEMEAFLATGCAKSCSAADASQARTMMGALLGCGRSTVVAWEGSASLSSTGNWSVQVAIGQEACGDLTRTVRAECMPSFIDSDGRCTCPAGQSNVNGNCEAVQPETDPCQLVVLSVGGSRLDRAGASATVRPGTALSVSFPPVLDLAAARYDSYQTVLVPMQGSETRNLAEAVLFRSTGSYSLQLQYAAMSASGASERRCTVLPLVEVKCEEF